MADTQSSFGHALPRITWKAFMCHKKKSQQKMTMCIFTFPLKTEVYQISRDFFTNSLSPMKLYLVTSKQIVPMMGKYSTEMDQTKQKEQAEHLHM